MIDQFHQNLKVLCLPISLCISVFVVAEHYLFWIFVLEMLEDRPDECLALAVDSHFVESEARFVIVMYTIELCNNSREHVDEIGCLLLL